MRTLCAATPRGRTTPRRASLTCASTTRSRPSGPRSQPLAARAAICRPAVTGSPGPFVDPGASWHVLAALPTESRGSGGHRSFPRMSRSTGRQACSAAGQGRGMARHLIGGDGALATSFPWRNRFVWPRMRAPSRPATEPALDQGLVPSRGRPPTPKPVSFRHESNVFPPEMRMCHSVPEIAVCRDGGANRVGPVVHGREWSRAAERLSGAATGPVRLPRAS